MIKPIVLGEKRIVTKYEVMPDDTIKFSVYRMPSASDTAEGYKYPNKDIVAVFHLLSTANDFIAKKLIEATAQVKKIAEAKSTLELSRKIG